MLALSDAFFCTVVQQVDEISTDRMLHGPSAIAEPLVLRNSFCYKKTGIAKFNRSTGMLIINSRLVGKYMYVLVCMPMLSCVKS